MTRQDPEQMPPSPPPHAGHRMSVGADVGQPSPSPTSVAGSVLSVNVGAPRRIHWQGTTFSTGIFKDPVEGRIPVLPDNLQGDGQGDPEVHGGPRKAVFVYAHEHYDHWREWLGTDDLPFGLFGENFTTLGLDDHAVALGDRFRIGDAEFVVTEPRQPCYKVDARLRRAGAAAEMIRSNCVGFYLGLLTPGSVAAGDLVEHLGGPTTNRVTPGRLHQLNTSATLDDLDELEHVAQLPEVDDWWSRMLRIKAAGLRRSRDRKRVAPWIGRRQFIVDEVVPETDDVVSVYLKPTDRRSPLPPVEPGQFLTITLPGTDTGLILSRSYTVSGVEPDRWRITVRRASDSQGGSAQVHRLTPSDLVGIRPPAGDFTLRNHPPGAPVVLVSAGIGITPMVAMARECEKRGGMTLLAVHAMRSGTDNALMTELADSVAACADGRLVTFVDDGTPLAPGHHGVHIAGRPTAEALQNAVQPVADGAHFYLCGPPGFMDFAGQVLDQIGVPSASVHREAFLTPSNDDLPVEVPPGGLEVMFAQESRTALWGDPEVSLLDLAEDMGLSVPASCRQGVCGTCVTPILDGEVTYMRTPRAAFPEGSCLACIAVPKTRLLLDL